MHIAHILYIFSEKSELIINIKKEKITSVSKFRELTVDSKEAIAVVLIPWPQQLGWTVFYRIKKMNLIGNGSGSNKKLKKVMKGKNISMRRDIRIVKAMIFPLEIDV